MRIVREARMGGKAQEKTSMFKQKRLKMLVFIGVSE
jgi:hypothetical protein